MSVEHIMPQQWRQHWNDRGQDQEEAERVDSLINEIGNLTLVSSKLNSRLSNRPWTDSDGTPGKRTFLNESSTLLMTREVCTQHPLQWTKQDIRNRSLSLIEQILTMWPAPAGHTLEESTRIAVRATSTSLLDLIQAGILQSGTVLYHALKFEHGSGIATVSATGQIEYADHVYDSPSAAGRAATGWKSADGWIHWRAHSPGGPLLAELRARFAAGPVEASTLSPPHKAESV